MALPLLEAMSPAFATQTAPPPRRLVFICTALGLYPPHLWPNAVESAFDTPYMQLFKNCQDRLTLFSGLQHEDQSGRQPHDSELTFLTAARNPGMSGFRNSISIDQLAAKTLGKETRFASLTLGTDQRFSQSYTEHGVMIPAETSPAAMFQRLFLKGSVKSVTRQRQELQRGKSVLDKLKQQANQVRRKASRSDNRLLDDYFHSVREAEKQISIREHWIQQPKPEVNAEIPTDIENDADLVGRMKRMLKLVPLIVQTDSCRVISMLIHNHTQVPVLKGVTGGHHNLSHHGKDAGKIRQLKRVETAILTNFESLIQQLNSVPELNGSLLNQTTVLFGSNLGNANSHSTADLPIFVAGGGHKHVGFLNCDRQPALSSLFLNLLRKSNVKVGRFGDHSVALNWD